MSIRAVLLIYCGDYEWIDYKRRCEVTSLMNPYDSPEGSITAIEVDPNMIEQIKKLLKGDENNAN